MNLHQMMNYLKLTMVLNWMDSGFIFNFHIHMSIEQLQDMSGGLKVI